MKNDINKDLQGQDYTDKAFYLDKVMDKGSGVGFWILAVLTLLGCYGLLWAILALPYLIG
jgi:hypothetical protein